MPKANSIEAAARAADSISDGDIISIFFHKIPPTCKRTLLSFLLQLIFRRFIFVGDSIFRKQDFELLPSHGLMSAIIPGHHAHTGGRKAYAGFPLYERKRARNNTRMRKKGVFYFFVLTLF